ncbi:uncharacterized protein FIBRA_07425 [Fibroporia radiculosa]|uniref:Calpain catalytic domain-containing protein n=1 Tax=Fibroporia radiculosa TaxID=599839 RepID=J4GUY7_9APHY|nr:uncharacterized protein FIBRA_07425 [Fibroporia radiculosa]CCM05215.1 predicted protein [Fibroporia radiculosa]
MSCIPFGAYHFTTIFLAQDTYSNAAKAELQRDLDRAFRLYIKAAEDFVHLGQVCHDARLRAACKNEANKALERAEKIKHIKPDVSPVAKNYFSERVYSSTFSALSLMTSFLAVADEQSYVLRKSSFVNNVRIPLWDEDKSTGDDVGQPKLSAEQQRHSAEWHRKDGAPVYSASPPILPQDILQHIITDCSVCAIDDQLPTYPDGRLMCASTGSKHQIWPSLMEKAYMKLMGGYDFPGSYVFLLLPIPHGLRGSLSARNSCVDLHALTGWIPEPLDLRSANIQRERLWARLFDGFSKGYCLLTVGTGDGVIAPLEPSLRLIPTHCYAVIDVRNDHGRRQLTILDSWLHDEPSDQDGYVANDGSTSTQTGPDSSKTFDLPWDSVCNIFDGVYLSWDPGIFRRHIRFHGTWKARSPSLEEENRTSSYFRLQLRAHIDQAIQGGQALWLQLSRHAVDTSRTSEYISLLVNNDDDSGPMPIDVAAMGLKGEYTNSLHTLVRVQVTAADPVLNIIAAYDGHFNDVGFTVTAYSNTNISWVEDIPEAMNTKEIDGAFTSKTAGGNHSYPTFMDNPQYHLRLFPDKSLRTNNGGNIKAPTSVVLQGPRDVPLNLSLVWSQGERITEMGHNEVAATSGPYSYGYSHISQDLQVGDYTLIASTFEPHHQGSFQLRVNSPFRFELVPIPQEGAGMFSRVFRDAWTIENAGGGPSSRKYATNPAYEIQLEAPTQLKIRLQLSDSAPRVAVNVSIFHPRSMGGALIATSGPYSDALAGVVTPHVTLQPGTYLCIPSTYHPGVQRAYKLLVYSTIAVKVSVAEKY